MDPIAFKTHLIIPAGRALTVDDGGVPGTPVQFGLACDADEVHLRLVGGDRAVPELLAMEARRPGRWDVVVPLRPGLYRYRYLVRQGRATFGYPPWGQAGTHLDGFDRMFHVPGPLGCDHVAAWPGSLATADTDGPAPRSRQSRLLEAEYHSLARPTGVPIATLTKADALLAIAAGSRDGVGRAARARRMATRVGRLRALERPHPGERPAAAVPPV